MDQNRVRDLIWVVQGSFEQLCGVKPTKTVHTLSQSTLVSVSPKIFICLLLMAVLSHPLLSVLSVSCLGKTNSGADQLHSPVRTASKQNSSRGCQVKIFPQGMLFTYSLCVHWHVIPKEPSLVHIDVPLYSQTFHKRLHFNVVQCNTTVFPLEIHCIDLTFSIFY